MSSPSEYEKDILQQPDALSDPLHYALPAGLYELDVHSYDRIVLAGMGSSDYALIPVEHELIARGLPVWRVDAGRLLDMPQLITQNTLLWMTSQSGMSGEVVKVVEVTGESSLLHLDWNGFPVHVQLTGRIMAKPGETVALNIDPRHVHLFDKESGVRL
ncbi:hypothetical protein [Mixta mediterraneensis]|uniref:hypothetical protein n=1 Tax=Mixta mediterraneensis TaxID=2758443 RepID=UPI0018735268|nr:hypothetical protein [Mixta mediterraneensis]MBE5253847.1 hypothetical protein [Mixta mediterraneensis]